jgi:hypothetical protein
MEWELHERREEALHPFSADPGRSRSRRLGVVALGALVVLFVILVALIVVT